MKFRVQQLKMYAGIGTHIDAFAHCIPGGATIEQLPLQSLITHCIVIDVSHKAHPEFCIAVEDILAFEQKHGPIPPKSFVILYTGWDQYWHDPAQYHNNLIFPSVSEGVAQLLLERDIAGLGLDTLGPDRPNSGFPVHKALLGGGKYIVENIANTRLLPTVGSFTLALPIKIAEATEAPIRLIGLIPKK